MSDAHTREEHMAWSKARALQLLDAGDAASAVASMMSDVSKHPHTRLDPALEGFLGMVGLMTAMERDTAGTRRWIEDFG